MTESDIRGLEDVVRDSQNAGGPLRAVALEKWKDSTVYYPESSAEVASLLATADGLGFKVSPVGRVSSIKDYQNDLSKGSLALCLDRLGAIKSVNRSDMLVVSEAGATLLAIDEAVRAEGLMLPSVECAERSDTLGGTIATNGQRSQRSGPLGDYILAMTYVTPSGETVVTGSHAIKQATGYNLAQSLRGSWGSLGVITEVTLRLLPATSPAGSDDRADSKPGISQLWGAPFRSSRSPAGDKSGAPRPLTIRIGFPLDLSEDLITPVFGALGESYTEVSLEGLPEAGWVDLLLTPKDNNGADAEKASLGNLSRALRRIGARIIGLWGSGLGYEEYLRLAHPEAVAEALFSLKAALDPKGTLVPAAFAKGPRDQSNITRR